MARAMTQTVAWGLATFMSGVVFASGYGVFKLMLPKDAQHSAHGSSDGHGGHGDSGHAEAGHGESHGDSHSAGHGDSQGSAEDKSHGSDHGSGHGESHAAGHGEPHDDGHGSKGGSEKSAHGAVPEHPADSSQDTHDKGHGSAKGGHEEEEISADQFKQGESHH